MDYEALDHENNGWIKEGTIATENERRLYYLQDEQKTVTSLITENNFQSVKYKYDVRGNPNTTEHFNINWSGPDNTIGYTGYEYDYEAELYYAQARYYDPTIGRFTAKDPVKGKVIEPITINPYPYVKNNPIKYVDPTGEVAESSFSGKDESNGTASYNSQLIYTKLNLSNIRPAVIEKINHYIDKINTMSDMDTSWEPLYKMNVKWTRADYEKALDDLLADLTSPTGAAIENVLNKSIDVISGSLQFVGGLTEAGTGSAIATGATWTGVGIPIGLAGGYIAVDGASNVTGGASKIYNALFGENEGDTLNFMKNAYIALNPNHGENIYNVTQLGIGLFTIGKGLTELPSNSVTVYARPKNISRAYIEGLSTKTVAIDVGESVVLTTKTNNGMILQKTIVNKSKLTNGTLLIGVDMYNTNE